MMTRVRVHLKRLELDVVLRTHLISTLTVVVELMVLRAVRVPLVVMTVVVVIGRRGGRAVVVVL